MFLPAGVVRLEADRFDAAVDPESVGAVHYGLGWVDLGEVDRDGAELLGQREPVGFLVDDEHLSRAAEHGAVRGHQADRAGAEDGDRLAGGDVGPAPCRGSRSGRCRRAW